MSELVCITLDGVRYAIRGDRVLSRERVRSLHRLPFADPRGGVLAMIGGRAETLADLSVCLGHSPTQAAAGAVAFIMSNDPPVRGFVVGGDLAAVADPGGSLVPVPPCVSGTPFEGFVAAGATNSPGTSATNPPGTSPMPLPVLDIEALYAKVRAGAWTASRSRLAFSRTVAAPFDPSMPHRVIDAAGGLYALAGRRQWEPLRLETVFRCPLLPIGIDGIILSDGTADPVVDLGRRMGCPESLASLAVLTTIGDTRFAVLMDEDRGVWEPGSAACRALPPLACPRGIAGVLQRSGESALLLDLGALLSDIAGVREPAQAPPWQPNSQASDFPSRFGRGEVEVQEVVLLGMRHALPKSEVHAVVPRIPFRKIPLAPAVVTGVAEYEGDLLPVLDLSAGFGGEPQGSSGQDMIVLQSAGFRALLLSERVLSERRVRRDDQRPVPYAASHPFLYGCYIDGDAVRLIFNISAIAMQFSVQPVGDVAAMLAHALGLAPQNGERPVRSAGETAGSRPAYAGGPGIAPAPATDAPKAPEVAAAAPEQAAAPAASKVSTPESSVGEPASIPIAPRPPDASRSSEAIDGKPPGAAATRAAPELSSEAPRPKIQEGEAQPSYHASADPAGVRDAAPGQVTAGPAALRPAPRPRQRRWLAAAAAALVAAAVGLIVFMPAVRSRVFRAPGANPGAPAAPAAAAPSASPAPAAGNSGSGQPAGPGAYVVAAGDTLWTIAARLTGDPYQFGRLAIENGIADPDRIVPGQIIRLSRK